VETASAGTEHDAEVALTPALVALLKRKDSPHLVAR